MPRELPGGLRGRVFTLDQAWDAGLTHARLRRADLRRPFRGIRAPASAAMLDLELIHAYALHLPEDQYFSHLSALRLHQVWVPDAVQDDHTVHVTSVHRSERRSGAGVVGHFVTSGTDLVDDIDGLPVQSPADAWAAMASLLDDSTLVVLGDALLRRWHPAATVEDLRAAVGRRRGRRHCRRLNAALDLVRPRTDSVKESELRLMLVRWGFPEPAVNQPICDASGRFLGFGDLVYDEEKVVVEYDGGQHRTDEHQFERDIDRLDLFAQAGWRVIRAGQHHLRARQGELRARLGRALITRRPDPPGPTEHP